MKQWYFLLFLFSAVSSFSQNQNHLWFFGIHAGLDFSSGAPVSTSVGQTNTNEGSATVSDAAGNLLFYTDGMTVYNANHNVMLQGTGLLGNISSTQAALIVPQPGNDSIFFIFTTDAFGGSNGCKYSVVDMSLDNGLGQVTLKNVALHSPTTEKLIACSNSNGIDSWVITHKLGDDNFYVYPVTQAGVGSPVITAVGTVHGFSSCYGEAAYSCANQKLAIGVRSSNYVELFDFDPATGIPSNPIVINSYSGSEYGLEFSPDGNLLYVTTWDAQTLTQYDISSNNASTINASQQLIATVLNPLGTIARGNDGKLYVPAWGIAGVGVIDDPNVYGTGCTFTNASISTGGALCYYGLQNFPDCIYSNVLFPISNFISDNTTFCPGSCADFTDLSSNATSWEWLFPGATPATSSSQFPTSICYASPGSYDVTLIVSNLAGSDTLTFPDYITVYAPISVSISQSGNDLTCNPSAASYQWWMNGNAIPGATSQTLFINQTGLYVVTVSDSNGCTAADSINVISVPSPAFAASQVFLCEKFCIDFTDTSTNNPSSWQWLFPGATPPSSQLQNPSNICYDTPGSYDVTLITTNSLGNDTLTLSNYITVYPTPPFPVITQNGDTLTCTPASSYQWQFNSVDVAGATSQSFVAMQTGNYTVIISDANGCVNATTKYVDVTGLGDPAFNTSITIFPIPNNGTFTIECFSAITTDLYFSVTNALGQMIYSSEVKNITQGWKKEISLGEISNGIYYLQILAGNETAGFLRRKILIAR